MDLSEVRKFEQAKVGTIKLSEAIRIGAKKRPQARQMFFDYREGSSCAIGAALEGAGICTMKSWRPGVTDALPRHFNVTPEILHGVYERNDSGWPREQIADWLESQGY